MDHVCTMADLAGDDPVRRIRYEQFGRQVQGFAVDRVTFDTVPRLLINRDTSQRLSF